MGGVRGGAPLSIHQRNLGRKKFKAKSYPEKKKCIAQELSREGLLNADLLSTRKQKHKRGSSGGV